MSEMPLSMALKPFGPNLSKQKVAFSLFVTMVLKIAGDKFNKIGRVRLKI